MLACAFALGSPATTAQEVDPERYARVKAGYVLNFIRLTEWPPAAFEDEQHPVTIKVVGNDPMTPFLQELVRAERIFDRSVVLRRVLPLAAHEDDDDEAQLERFRTALRGAQLLYIGRDESRRLSLILESVSGQPVLTVSDIPAFAERGGMIGLVLQGDTVGIEANVQHLESSAVTVSSRVLRLAQLVAEE